MTDALPPDPGRGRLSERAWTSRRGRRGGQPPRARTDQDLYVGGQAGRRGDSGSRLRTGPGRPALGRAADSRAGRARRPGNAPGAVSEQLAHPPADAKRRTPSSIRGQHLGEARLPPPSCLASRGGRRARRACRPDRRGRDPEAAAAAPVRQSGVQAPASSDRICHPMTAFLVAYRPLIHRRAGRVAAERFDLPPFLDGSCRRLVAVRRRAPPERSNGYAPPAFIRT
jgi:hypothetical protein